MEIKRNEATVNRPEGDRVIDGTYVFIDIPSFVRQLTEEKAWEKNDRNGITVFKSSNITIVITALQADAEIKDNSVDGFLTLQVLEGSARIVTSDGDIDAVKNQVLALHPRVTHSIRAISDVIFLLTNYSKEEEYK
jgi:quercetin dioxygenase-like cupin family protein